MSFKKSVARFGLIVCLLAYAVITPWHYSLAAKPSSAVAPETTPGSTNPDNYALLAELKKGGAKIYYMGERSGLDGWFIVNGKQVQMAYTTKDGNSVLVGALFDKAGENVTVAQVKGLADKDPEFAAAIGYVPALNTIPSSAAVIAPSALPPLAGQPQQK